jgi:mannose-6-phosphate isomerase
MNTAGILRNPIQNYAWGSLTAIPALIGIPATDSPVAELWMGAHPKASSEVYVENQWQPLKDVINRNPVEMLGHYTAERFENRLPYLFKILAAARPLSIQAHPGLNQAKDGFERENHLGIPLLSPKRNYRDDNHKPEIICALTPFDALCGFRSIPEIIRCLTRYGGHCLTAEMTILKQKPDPDGLRSFFEVLMRLPITSKAAAIETIMEHTGQIGHDNPESMWINRLYAEYPQDIGVIFPLILNLIHLEPDHALFLPAGEPHAYLDGLGIELMANSDNVLRGGLTPKHIDVDELMRVLTFQEFSPQILMPVSIGNFESRYETPVDEFQLSVITLQNGETYFSRAVRSLEILLCIKGDAVIYPEIDFKPIKLARGASAIIPASIPAYRIQGTASLYKASVPIGCES